MLIRPSRPVVIETSVSSLRLDGWEIETSLAMSLSDTSLEQQIMLGNPRHENSQERCVYLLKPWRAKEVFRKEHQAGTEDDIDRIFKPHHIQSIAMLFQKQVKTMGSKPHLCHLLAETFHNPVCYQVIG